MDRFSWALVGPGRIAHRFAEAVQGSPGQQLVRVQGRDAARAAAFAQQWERPDRPAPRAGSDLAELLADPAVDAVYIATPHAQHAAAIEACLHAGKPVLCEKPLVATAAQAERVLALAERRGVFLMEAMWTRLLPLWQALTAWRDGADGIGELRAVLGSFGYTTPFEPEGRVWNPALAGGALLDIGIYLFTATRWALEREPGTAPEPRWRQVGGLLAPSGVDQRAWATLGFAGGAVAQWVCGLDFEGDNTVQLLGERGSIGVEAPFWGATRAVLRRPHRADEWLERPHAINGFEYQVEEAARCVRAGLRQSPHMPWTESLALARWLDAARRDVGVIYPFD
jgi:predicted dehydrogenase